MDFQISVETESGPHPPDPTLASAGFELSEVAFCEVNPQCLSWITHHVSTNRFYITITSDHLQCKINSKVPGGFRSFWHLFVFRLSSVELSFFWIWCLKFRSFPFWEGRAGKILCGRRDCQTCVSFIAERLFQELDVALFPVPQGTWPAVGGISADPCLTCVHKARKVLMNQLSRSLLW